MSTEEVVKSVAKKLKYYFEIKRLEDDFDVHQSVSHSSLKTGFINQYGMHDRSIKLYFSQPEVRAMLKQLNSSDASGALQGWREIEVRKMLDEYMKHYSFQSNLPSHYYSPTQGTQTSGILQRRKRKQRKLSAGWPVLQTVSDQHISKEEAERLINSATKIICGSEQFRSAAKLPYTFHKDIGKLSALRLSQTDFSRPTTARSGSTHRKSYSASPKKKAEKGRPENRKLRHRSLSPAPSSKSSGSSYRSTSFYSSESSYLSSSSETSISSSLSSSSYSDHDSIKKSPTKTMSPKGKTNSDKKQETGVGKSTQTEGGKDIDGKTGRNKVGSTEKEEVVDDGPLCEYQVYVHTGDRVGAGTNAPVKLILYGEKGRTKEFDLNKLSKKNKIPFQKGHEDLFILSSHHVGRLKKIQIGHDKPELNYAWYLDNVSVRDMHEKRSYQFPCGRWLSGQGGDKKTYRILLADSEREFMEASDSKMTKLEQTQGDGSRLTANDEHIKKTKIDEDIDNVTWSQIDSKNSSLKISSLARIENGSPRHRQGDGSQRQQKDSFKQEATKIILRSVPGSVVVDEILLYNGGTSTGDKAANEKDIMDNYKPPVTEQEQKRYPQRVKETEKGITNSQNIHEAVRSGDSAWVKQLLDKFPEIKNHRDESGRTPLHLAAAIGNTDMLRWLVTSQEDLKAETPSGQTALHIAAVNGHVNAMMILHAMGASIFAVTKDKQTALHLAAKSGHLECIKWLVANRASLDSKDSSGCTAFNLAEEYGQESCATFLRICSQELSSPRSSFAQMRGRRTSGSDLPPIKEDTTLGSSGNASKDGAEIQDKKNIYSD